MDSNPTAPMVREADRGAVIPTAGGERGLGQGRVCGGLIWPPFAPRPMPDPFQELGLCAFAQLHWSPLPQDLCQILSKSWDCALSRTCIHRR